MPICIMHAERHFVRRAQRKHAPRLRFFAAASRDELARSPRHACWHAAHRSCFPSRPPHPIDRGWTIGHGSKKHKARTRVHACRVRAASVHVNRPSAGPIHTGRSPLARHGYSLHNCMSIWQFCSCHRTET